MGMSGLRVNLNVGREIDKVCTSLCVGVPDYSKPKILVFGSC